MTFCVESETKRELPFDAEELAGDFGQLAADLRIDGPSDSFGNP